MAQDFQYIDLSFINQYEEIKRQIRNTVAVSFLLNKGYRETTLNSYLESTQYGYTASANTKGTHRLVRITDIIGGDVNWGNVPLCNCDTGEKYLLNEGDILVARTGGTTGKSFLINKAPTNAIFASYLIRLRVKLNTAPEFISIFLNSYVFWSQISELKSGSAQPNVNAEKLKTLIIPDCPKEIQKKIVTILNNNYDGKDDEFTVELKAEINNALSKLNRLELIKNEFALQQSYLQQLRQAILQEAVEGKLSEPGFAGLNDFSEERKKYGKLWNAPASELLQHIKAEKEKPGASSKSKKSVVQPIAADAIPFDLPEGWVWCRLQEIAYVGNGSTPDKKDFTDNSGDIPYLKVYNIVKQKINFKYKPQYVKSACHNGQLKRSITYSGDVLMNIVGPPLGKIAIVPEEIPECNINQAIVVIRPYFKNLNRWIYWFLCELSTVNSIVTKGTAGQDNISVTQSRNMVFPVPPLSEQYRIVAKVQQLLQIVQQLEQQVATSRTQAQQLLQAVLKETFGVKEKAYEENQVVTLAAED